MCLMIRCAQHDEIWDMQSVERLVAQDVQLSGVLQPAVQHDGRVQWLRGWHEHTAHQNGTGVQEGQANRREAAATFGPGNLKFISLEKFYKTLLNFDDLNKFTDKLIVCKIDKLKKLLKMNYIIEVATIKRIENPCDTNHTEKAEEYSFRLLTANQNNEIVLE